MPAILLFTGMITLAEDHYPFNFILHHNLFIYLFIFLKKIEKYFSETLGTICVINAPKVL